MIDLQTTWRYFEGHLSSVFKNTCREIQEENIISIWTDMKWTGTEFQIYSRDDFVQHRLFVFWLVLFYWKVAAMYIITQSLLKQSLGITTPLGDIYIVYTQISVGCISISFLCRIHARLAFHALPVARATNDVLSFELVMAVLEHFLLHSLVLIVCVPDLCCMLRGRPRWEIPPQASVSQNISMLHLRDGCLRKCTNFWDAVRTLLEYGFIA